ncbi:MAG: hypothetical protein J6039_06390 [Alphaproteobacteria bacterium]|nr:hypothetical protein [Alphaproteobacteria bacterium]
MLRLRKIDLETCLSAELLEYYSSLSMAQTFLQTVSEEYVAERDNLLQQCEGLLQEIKQIFISREEDHKFLAEVIADNLDAYLEYLLRLPMPKLIYMYEKAQELYQKDKRLDKTVIMIANVLKERGSQGKAN